jgi:hypothetical protein
MKHPGGRPRLANPKGRQIKVRFDDAQYDEICREALRRRKTLGEIVRERAVVSVDQKLQKS